MPHGGTVFDPAPVVHHGFAIKSSANAGRRPTPWHAPEVGRIAGQGTHAVRVRLQDVDCHCLTFSGLGLNAHLRLRAFPVLAWRVMPP